jgi:hypothetical protein
MSSRQGITTSFLQTQVAGNPVNAWMTVGSSIPRERKRSLKIFSQANCRLARSEVFMLAQLDRAAVQRLSNPVTRFEMRPRC